MLQKDHVARFGAKNFVDNEHDKKKKKFADALATLASMRKIREGVKVRPITIEQRSSPVYCNLIEIVEFTPGMFNSDI